MTDNTVPAAQDTTDDAAKAVETADETAAPAEETGAEEKDDKSTDEGGDTDADDAPKRQRPGKWARQLQRLEERNRALEDMMVSIYRQQNGGRQADTDAPKSGAASGPPKQEDFGSYEDFLVAKTKYEVHQDIATERRRHLQQQEQRSEAEIAATYNERCDAARDKYEDFDEVTQSKVLPITKAMASVIAASEQGPEIAYYLGTHLPEARRIAGLSPALAAAEVARLETKLSSPSAPAKKQTKAPAPVKTVKGSDKAQTDPDKMSEEDWLAWRRNDLKAKGMR